jgi:hypothetical protein
MTWEQRGLQPAYHAGSRVHGARHGIGADVAHAAAEFNGHDFEAVNVVEIFADGRLCVSGTAVAQNEIASCAVCNALGEVLVEMLEAVRSADVNLEI